MPDIVVNIDIWCASCGYGLCPSTKTRTPTRGSVNESFQVEACERCLIAARNEGRAEGYADGRDEAGG